MSVRVSRLLGVGFALLAAGIALHGLPASAAPREQGGVPPYSYTNHPTRASASSRTIQFYVDPRFNESERQSIVSALQQWNHVLNGFVRLRASVNKDGGEGRRNGAWVVSKVDSSHSIVQSAVGRHALGVTAGGSNGGKVYIIADRIGRRDLTAVLMHEFGHALGARHGGDHGLMGPVYSANSGHCIDREAAGMVASAQRLPVQQLNWCQIGGEDRERPRTADREYRAAPPPSQSLAEPRAPRSVGSGWR